MKPEQYWFKAKSYGWGWYPARWQGWVVLIAYIAALFFVYATFDAGSMSDSEILHAILPKIAALTLILLGICFLTGEKPRWRWGNR